MREKNKLNTQFTGTYGPKKIKKVLYFKLKVKLKWKKFCVIAFAFCYITFALINDKKMDVLWNLRYVSPNNYLLIMRVSLNLPVISNIKTLFFPWDVFIEQTICFLFLFFQRKFCSWKYKLYLLEANCINVLLYTLSEHSA